jgi:hypothetical protein
VNDTLTAPAWTTRLWKIVRLWSLIAVTSVVLGFALWTWGSLRYVYSSGERAGYVQKISQRGWIYKTWEGELAMVNLPGSMPEKFIFSVRKDDVARRIEKTLGNQVVLVYHQHRGIPLPIFGETDYFVVDVRPVLDAPVAAPPAVPVP